MSERLGLSGSNASVQRVEEAAARCNLAITVRTMEASTRTAADAAEAVGAEVGQIVKSLVFEDSDGDLALLLVCGAHEADLTYIADHHGLILSRADPRKVRRETGFAIGGVAPIGHISRVPVYMDTALFAFDEVWCAAGRPDSVFAAAPNALALATEAEIISMRGP